MPGHRELRARAHRHEQRVCRRSERRAASPVSSFFRFASISLLDRWRESCPCSRSRACRPRVEMVNPGGTGSPALVISARPAPLPPSRSFIVRSPSALPLPKKYTCFVAFAVRSPSSRLLRAFALHGSSRSSFAVHRITTPSPRFQKYRPAAESAFQPLHQPQPRVAQRRVVGHDEHFVEEARDRRLELPPPRRTPSRKSRPPRPRRRSPARAGSSSSSSATSAGSLSSASRRRLLQRRELLGVSSRAMLRTRLNAVASCRNGSDRENSGRPAGSRCEIGRPAVRPRDRAIASTARMLPPIGAALLERVLQPLGEERAQVRPDRSSSRGLAVSLPRAFAQRLERHAHARARRASRRRAGAAGCRAPARRSPNGSRDPVGRSPARNRPTSVSSLSASDTAAQVDARRRRAPPTAAPRRPRRRPAGSGGRSPSRPLPARRPRARRCRPSRPAAR